MTPTISDSFTHRASLEATLADTARLDRTVAQVLEAMFFLPPEESLPGGPAAEFRAEEAAEYDTSLVAFDGPLHGHFAIACRHEVSRPLAENFHGESPSAEEVTSVVLELSNIVCGNLLSQLPAQDVFALASPRPWGPEDWRGSGRPQLAVRTEAGWLGIWLTLRGERA
jgi:CheY-specific phosphatase CheX